MSKLRILTVAVGCLLVLSACGSSPHHVAASPKPPVVPGQVTAGPDLSGVQLPNFIMPLISGGVSVPKRALTPGAVTTTNTTEVCDRTPAQNAQTIPIGLESQVYSEYRIGPTQQSRYLLDLLVPISLGGAMTLSNIWPATVEGTGFVQKAQLDHILKDDVCHRFLTLRQAQRALETNWYAAWLKYVVATGHF
jgi:hypothetical protein